MHHSTGLHRTGHAELDQRDNVDSPTSPAKILFDIEKYQAMIDDDRLSNDQRRELVLAIWSLLMIVSDLGFKLDTVDA